MENPFIKYWLWHYDMLWQYWPVVFVLLVIALWLIARGHYKRQRNDSTRRKLHEDSIAIVDTRRIHDGYLACEGKNFRVVVHDGELIYFDKKTGKSIIKKL